MKVRVRVSLRAVALVSLAVLVAACGGDSSSEISFDSPGVVTALASIEAANVDEHIRVLADDSLRGRRPGTAGYEGAMRYVETTLASLGLEPAGIDGTFTQPVPLRHSIVQTDASSFSLTSTGRVTELSYGDDFYLSPDHMRTESEVSAPVAFVGFGVSAPAFGYDDYAGIDVEGKIVAYISGAPSSLPSNERAYYSSGTTKSDEAIARGAVGTVSFNSPDDPRFRWENSVNRSSAGSYVWVDPAGDPRGGGSPIRGAASLNHSAVRALFTDSPTPLDEVFAAAAANSAQSFNLPIELTMRVATTHRPVDSHNVIAKLYGSDPQLRDEHLVYVAHVDHFGVGVAVDGDDIYNGAHDNASGTSIVLEIAKAFSSLPEAPRRSVLFLFVTAEEWGLLGSDYFAAHPTVPAQSLVANLSLDMPFLFHPLLDIVPYGAEHSTLSRSLGAAAEHLGMAIGPDPIPEQVLFIRSDHFSFVRRGIPALFIKSGFETGDPYLDGSAINANWRVDFYHTPRDEADQGFDFEAGASHAKLNFLTGYDIAMRTERPEWNPDDFFGAVFGGQR